ncbi:MAG TPA: GTP 3',8-cyclase MoaA [Syntrophomonadaceae bacterium]|nr:GTP 3',8-cyclase MoaA [Syntrophomonadaceae bacterium]
MIDTLGRNIDYLRISVTDRCNLRCRYCMPEEGIENQGHHHMLSFEQLYRIVKVANKIGINKVRLTGGEPLVRKNIVQLIRAISALSSIEDISLTTNGILFPEMANDLKQAGISRVNISLDTLDKEKYKYITLKGNLDRVFQAIEKALSLDMDPVKINVVVMKGFNDDEILDFARLTYELPVHVRFIEFMPIGDLDFHTEDKVLTIGAVKSIIEETYNLEYGVNIKGHGPANYAQIAGGKGSLGFISPLSNHFCNKCNRMRLTADGKLRGCLYSQDEIDLRLALCNDCTDEQLLALFKKAILMKPAQHHMLDGWGKNNNRKMYQIGG